MLTGALLMVLTASGAGPIAESQPRAARLADAEALPSYPGWTAAQMRAEHARVMELRPQIGVSIAMIQMGGTGLAVTLFGFAIALGGFRGPDTTALIGTALGLTTSLSLVGIAVALLYRAYPDRAIYTAQLEELERAIATEDLANRLLDNWEKRRGHKSSPPLLGPPPEGPPPPKLPMAPGQVSISIPLVFARF